jgi:amino acid transporter
MSTEQNDQRSLMDATGLGLLPGLALATILICAAMAALLTGSMWAVGGVLLLIVLCVAAVVYVVLAISAEGEQGERMRRTVPGLQSPDDQH